MRFCVVALAMATAAPANADSFTKPRRLMLVLAKTHPSFPFLSRLLILASSGHAAAESHNYILEAVARNAAPPAYTEARRMREDLPRCK